MNRKWRKHMTKPNDLQNQSAGSGSHPKQKVLFSKREQESFEEFKQRVVDSLRKNGFPVRDE
jgi:hypothetical protein